MTSPSETKRPLASFPRLLKAAVQLLWGADRKMFLALVGLQFVTGAGVTIQLLVGREVLTTILASRRPGVETTFADLALPVAVLIVATTAMSFAVSAIPAVARLVGELSVAHAFKQIFKAANSVELASFEDPTFYDRLQRARTHGLAPYQVANHISTMASALFTLVGVGIALLMLEPILVPLILLGYVPLLIATSRNSNAFYNFTFGFAPVDRAILYCDSVLTGKEAAAEVRAFGLFPWFYQRNEELNDERLGSIRQLARSEIRRGAWGSLASSFARAGTFALLGWFVLSGRLGIAAAATAALAVQQLSLRLDGVNATAASMYEQVRFLDDLVSFISIGAAPTQLAPKALTSGPAALEQLVLDDVRFRYPNAGSIAETDRPEAIAGVSMTIEKGEVIALVGENGSGKTTLAKLICSLYKPNAGQVLWNGQDVSTLPADAMREKVSVLFQDFMKYQLTANENIAAGRYANAENVAAIQSAARNAGASEFLEPLANGYETILSKQWEGGIDLSIGQWQRVAMARAFFRDADLVVLDEPTAALDPRAEYEVFRRLREIFAGKTIIFISHRFSSVRSADRIFVLDRGQVVESGTHAQLMRNGAQYHELFTIQASQYLDDPSAAASSDDAGTAAAGNGSGGGRGQGAPRAAAATSTTRGQQGAKATTKKAIAAAPATG